MCLDVDSMSSFNMLQYNKDDQIQDKFSSGTNRIEAFEVSNVLFQFQAYNWTQKVKNIYSWKNKFINKGFTSRNWSERNV